MLVLNWNFFSGGGDIKYNDERSYRHAELRYRLDDQRRRIVQTLSAQYATIASTRERLSAGYKELKSISAAAEAMSKRMLSGNQSLLDLLDVYDRRYQARVRLVNLHSQEMAAVAQVVRLVRGLPGAVADPTMRPGDAAEPQKATSSLKAIESPRPEAQGVEKGGDPRFCAGFIRGSVHQGCRALPQVLAGEQPGTATGNRGAAAGGGRNNTRHSGPGADHSCDSTNSAGGSSRPAVAEPRHRCP